MNTGSLRTLLQGRPGARCVVAVEQKGDDPAECRQRVEAGCRAFQTLSGQAADVRLVVVGGAGGDIDAATLHAWCAPSGVSPEVRNESLNTHDKAESIADALTEHGADTLVQVTSLYHALRAHLTTTAVLRARNIPIAVVNHAADSSRHAAVQFALLDEILLAKQFEPALGFEPDSDLHDHYIRQAQQLSPDPGLRTYLERRLGEARRIAAYAEPGKAHLVTDLPIKEILGSFPG